MSNFAKNLILRAVAVFSIVGCSQGTQESQLSDMSLAQKIERIESESNNWQVTCKDGHTEIRTTEQVKSEEYCVPAKTCQTFAEIEQQLNSKYRKFEGKFPNSGDFELTTKEVNDRFCLHTVTDGTKHLQSGQPIEARYSGVKDGLIIAIADSAGHAWAAGAACRNLTLLGKKWRLPLSSSGDVIDSTMEIDDKLSSFEIGLYLLSENTGARYSFWTGSVRRKGFETVYSDARTVDWPNWGEPSIYGTKIELGVRCVPM